MAYNYNCLKRYIKLLRKYIRYDIRILIYILLLLTFVFFNINYLLDKEINKNLVAYGGINESMTTYNIELDNDASKNELSIILDLFDEFHIENIKEIWLKFGPLSKVGVEYSTDSPVSYKNIKGRGFTRNERNSGKKVIILSNEDYLNYYSDYRIGATILLGDQHFKLIGISYDSDQSIIPFKCLLGDHMQGAFDINHLVIKTERHINKRAIRNKTKEYYNKSGKNNSEDLFKIKPLFWNAIEDIFNNFIDYFFSIILLLLFCLLSLFQTCYILYYKNQTHQSAFLYSGGSNEFLKHILYGEILITILVSFLLSHLIILGEKIWIS